LNEEPDHIFELEHEGHPYCAKVWHYSQLTLKEKLDYRITENCFLIFLTGPQEFKPFEIFIGEDLEWHTPSTFVVDDELVGKIGLLIDNESM
jgi:hypothetical protein